MQVEQQRPAAQQAYDIRRVRDAAASLGENGAKALSTSYDGSVRADDYYAGFASYYEAGISGIDMGKVQSRYAAQLNQAQRFAAYPPVRTTRRPPWPWSVRASRAPRCMATEAGLRAVEHSASLPKETVRFLQQPGPCRRGENPDGRGHRQRAAQTAGTATASSTSPTTPKNPGTVVAKHEITHRMREMAPEAYRKYRDYAMSALTERDGSTASIVEQYKSRYAEAGVNPLHGAGHGRDRRRLHRGADR